MGVGTTRLSVEHTNQCFFGEFFNENSPEYLSKSAGSRWFKYLLLKTLEYIHDSSVKSVADIGCGIGHKTVTLKEHFGNADVNGFDFSKSAITIAKKAYGNKGIRFSCEDITKSKYRRRYDLICAFDVLEHIEDWQGLVNKLSKVNNRYMLFSFPVGRMRPYEVNIGHFRNFQKNQMETFMSSIGYKTVHKFYAGFPFFSPILRDLTNIFFKNYSEISHKQMGKLSKTMHSIWYFLFRYCSFKQRGDVFIGLFEKNSQNISEFTRKG